MRWLKKLLQVILAIAAALVIYLLTYLLGVPLIYLDKALGLTQGTGFTPIAFLLPRVLLVWITFYIGKKRNINTNRLFLLGIAFVPIASLVYIPFLLSKNQNKLDNT